MGESDLSVSTDKVHEETDELLVKATHFGGKNLGASRPSVPGSKRQKREDGTIELLKQLINDNKIIKPPNDLDMLSRATLISSRLAKSIDIMAKNVVGLGFDIVDTLSIDERRNVDSQTQKKIDKQKKDLKDFLIHANPEKPFQELMKLVKIDEEALGNGYLEVIRDNEDVITGLAHLPGRTMRLRKDKPGFVQIRGNKSNFFIPFKSEDEINPKDGEDLEGTFTREDMATEVIHFKLEHPIDDFYGIPRWFPAIPSITGNRLADVRNISFMENDATPRVAIIISGGNLDPASVQGIKDFINIQGKGVEKVSRVMVLQTEKKQIGPQAGEPPKIELIPLTVGIEDDASFLKFRQANNDEIKEVFGLTDLLYGMSRDINRAAAAVAKQVTNEQEFEPERERISHILKHLLFPELDFETDLVTIQFKSPLINDLSSLADGFSKAARAGGLTPNDIRQMIGLSPYPKTAEYDWADFPVVMSLAFIEIGAFGLTDEEDDDPERSPEAEENEDGKEDEEEDEEKSKNVDLNFRKMFRSLNGKQKANIARRLKRMMSVNP